MRKLFKKLALGACIVMMLFASTANANNSNWKTELTTFYTSPTDSESIVQSAIGYQLNLKYNQTYLALSQETTELKFGGQRGSDMTLYFVGFGFEENITNNLSLFIEGGYYHPNFKHTPTSLPDPSAEGLHLYLNQVIDYPMTWPLYTVYYSGNFGGKAGMAFSRPITNNISFIAKGAYKFLRLPEGIKGYDPDTINNGGGYWILRNERDFGSWQFYVGFEVDIF